jgi:HEAT repeat protein
MDFRRTTPSLAVVPFLVAAATCLAVPTGGTHAPGSALSERTQEGKATVAPAARAHQDTKGDQRPDSEARRPAQEPPLVAQEGRNQARDEADSQGATSEDPVVQQLIENLSDKDWQTRAQAAQKLGKMGRRSAAVDAVPELEKALTGDIEARRGYGFVHEVHDNALYALKQLAPDRVRPALLTAAKSRNGDVKRWAVDQLTKTGDEK